MAELGRATYFQKVHVWPVSETLDHEGWLRNFDVGDDRDLAQRILDFFSYYSGGMVAKMLRQAVGQAGQMFSSHFSDWAHPHFHQRCYYSFIPGENPHPTDSGHLFVRALRDILHVDEDRILDFAKIPSLLTNATEPLPVVFVDDFIGTGSQCVCAWARRLYAPTNTTLAEIVHAGGHCCVYAAVMANHIGHTRIARECPSLCLSVTHILGPEYSLFDPTCICWANDADLYRRGVDLIMRKSVEAGISSHDGSKVVDSRGFGGQGLAIAFSHGAPDAIPALFYWCDNNWTPLIHRPYTR